MGEESLTFAPYNALQIEDILVQRAKMAFNEGVIDPLVLSYCSRRAALEHGDARKALDLLRIASEIAEREGEEIVTVKYVSKAQNVMEQDLVRNLVSTLPIQHKATLASIILNRGPKEKGQQTTGEVYNTYSIICRQSKIDPLTQRRMGHIISELDMQGLINAKVVSLGRQGRTRYISMAIEKNQIDSVLNDDSFLSRIIKDMKMSGYLSSMQLRLI
jgi:cell division control protein 6